MAFSPAARQRLQSRSGHVRAVLALSAALCATVSGCYRGYKSPKELDSDERGPKACATACKELGLQMSAFVLVERQTSGCVCSPADKPAALPGPVAAAAATQVVEQKKQEATTEQRREQTSVVPP